MLDTCVVFYFVGLTVKVNGTLVSDNICMCDLEQGFWDRKKQKNPKSCWYTECDIGHELTENGMYCIGHEAPGLGSNMYLQAKD